MGKAFSCCARLHNKEELEPINENSRLLSKRKPKIREPNGSDIIHNILPEECLADQLNKIDNNNCETENVEQRLVKGLIDITSIGRTLDKSECNVRTRIYEKRLSRINKCLVLKSKIVSQSLVEEPICLRNFKPISVEDFELITNLSERASEAVINGFKIKSKDPIVVSLMPWK